ncbi:MAG: type II secretion system protein [Patescibacteria group bacterium]
MKKINRQSGFTLLEVIVVIFIVSLGLLGVLSLTTQNIRVQYINKNNLIASQLAQEGLELARNIRDTNWLIPGNDWNQGLADGTYKIDYVNGIQPAIGLDDAKLYINGSGLYQHTPLSDTNFSRLITVTNSASIASSTIRCEVQWKERNNTYKYIAETELYDWR